MSAPRVLVVRSGVRPFLGSASVGLEIVEVVSHRIEPVEASPEIFSEPADFVVFTSQVAVERVLVPELEAAFRLCAREGRIAAVGAATEAALRARGLPPDIVARGSAQSLLELLPANLSGRCVLLPCGEDASDELPDGLRGRGGRVVRAVVYRKVANLADPLLDREVLDRPFAAFCATSPAAVHWLLTGVGPAAAERLCATPAVALGPSTRRALETRGVKKIEVSPQARFAAAARMLEALASAEASK